MKNRTCQKFKNTYNEDFPATNALSAGAKNGNESRTSRVNQRVARNHCVVRIADSGLKQELYGSKFSGVVQDGARKDWMATADIQRRLTEIQRTLTLLLKQKAPILDGQSVT